MSKFLQDNNAVDGQAIVILQFSTKTAELKIHALTKRGLNASPWFTIPSKTSPYYGSSKSRGTVVYGHVENLTLTRQETFGCDQIESI